jgi:hypothetical protein
MKKIIAPVFMATVFLIGTLSSAFAGDNFVCKKTVEAENDLLKSRRDYSLKIHVSSHHDSKAKLKFYIQEEGIPHPNKKGGNWFHKNLGTRKLFCQVKENETSILACNQNLQYPEFRDLYIEFDLSNSRATIFRYNSIKHTEISQDSLDCKKAFL